MNQPNLIAEQKGTKFVNFELTDEQNDITKAAREFAEKEFPDIAQECDREEKTPDHLWKKIYDLGFVGVFIPEAYGGPGLGYREHCLIHEEFWRADPGIGLSILSTCFGSEIILLFGTEEQKKKCLPLITRGEAITGAAITEPDAGSEAPRPQGGASSQLAREETWRERVQEEGRKLCHQCEDGSDVRTDLLTDRERTQTKNNFVNP